MRNTKAALALVLALGVAGTASAQSAAPPPLPAPTPADPAEGEEGDEVVITGQRPFGSVASDIKPEQLLSPADIRSYGVSSVAELLTELAPQTNAGGGQPVVLLNGKRISGFQEIREIPVEAIERVEILPEDVSLSYGYPANQKVVNVVLRRRFRAWTGEGSAGATTDGGRENAKVDANLLRIQRDSRLSVDVTYATAAQLLERDRDLATIAPSRPFSLAGNVTAVPGAASAEIDPALSALAGRIVTVAAAPASAAGGPVALAGFVPGANMASSDDLGRYRSLNPATDNLAINATIARPLWGKTSGSLNGRVEFSGTDSLQGLPGLALLLPAGNPFSPFSRATEIYRYAAAAGPLAQRGRTGNIHIGGTANGELKGWSWTLTGDYDRVATRTRTERGIDVSTLQVGLNAGDPTLNPFGALPPAALAMRLTDTARSRSSDLSADLLVTGALFQLPAGKATTSITLSGATSDFSSRSLRAGVARSADFSRDIAGVKGNIDLPIASKRHGVLGGLGELALNGNAEVQRLSDYGQLTTFGFGLRWTPMPAIRLIVSHTDDRAAPSAQQLSNPLIVTPNVPIFDYRAGQTVFVSQLSGGNPDLVRSTRHRFRLSTTVKPWSAKDFTLTGLFTRNRTDNPIGNFPTPTPQIEAALPGRFQRDATGALLQVDTRPINYAERHSATLRYGFNFSVPLKSSLQKKIEAWRAAGAKPEDRPAELATIRDLYQRARRGQPAGSRGDRDPPAAAPADSGPAGTTATPTPGESPGDVRPQPDGDRPGGFSGGGGRGFSGRGFGGFGGRGGGGGRLQFALFHTWHLEDKLVLAPGAPVLDLLDGAAIETTGGQPRHEVEAQAGYSNNGLGARLSGNWRSATRVDGALGTTSSTLDFGSLATLDLRLFANLGQIPAVVRAHPFLSGSRVTLNVTNLFGARQDVRDAGGLVPVNFQPDRLDPLGRRFLLSFRKLLF